MLDKLMLFAQLDSFLDNDIDIMLQLTLRNNNMAVTKLVQFWKRSALPKNCVYAENVIPRFITEDYGTHFRVNKEIFQTVLDKIVNKLIFVHAGGHDQVPPYKQLLVFLCYMANQESMREIGQYFGIGASTVHITMERVMDAFTCNTDFSNVIKWPSALKQNEMPREIQLLHGLPDIVDALDGTHIRLSSCPGEDNDYINRKRFPSIQLQILVDNEMLITNAYTGWPGCSHDAIILRNSSLYDMAEGGNLLAPQKIIIADSAYPLRNWLVTPFRDTGHLNAQQRRFNSEGNIFM